MSNSKAVVEWRRRTKVRAVEILGGKCEICGYDTNYGALEFHHTYPSVKEFAIGNKGIPRAWDRVESEIQKCQLLCSNCHASTHEGPSRFRKANSNNILMNCSRHGETDFRKERKRNIDGWTCVECSLERSRKSRINRKLKIVEALGGACIACGFSKNICALDAHHVLEKEFSISKAPNLSSALNEAIKCVLLCRNCHKEHHYPHLNKDSMRG